MGCRHFAFHYIYLFAFGNPLDPVPSGACIYKIHRFGFLSFLFAVFPGTLSAPWVHLLCIAVWGNLSGCGCFQPFWSNGWAGFFTAFFGLSCFRIAFSCRALVFQPAHWHFGLAPMVFPTSGRSALVHDLS